MRIIRKGLPGLFLLVLAGPLAAQINDTSYDFVTPAGGVQGGADGVGNAAQFSIPSGLAIDSVGNLYVADAGSSTIRKISPVGVVTTIAGTAGVIGSADGTGASAQFNGPEGIAVDESGNIYVADTINNTIRKITAAGVVTTIAGSAGKSGSVDGTGPSAQFNYPTGVAVDSNGNIFVADSYNYTIREITAGGVVSTLAGTAGVIGGLDGVGPSAQFYQPTGVAVDTIGGIYVTDNHRVRKITSGAVVTTIAGTEGTDPFETPSYADGSGSAAQFPSPFGVAVDDSGDVFVSDSYYNTIRKITPLGVVTTIGGAPGVRGNSDGPGPAALFSQPKGLAVDSSGAIYVADGGNHSIRKGTEILQSAQISVANLDQSYDGTPKSPTVVTDPAGLAAVIVYFVDDELTENAPSMEGSYPFYALVADLRYSGSTSGTLTIGPGLPAHTSLLVRNAQPGGSTLWGIAAGPAGLVTVGDGGVILSSKNGQSWTNRVSGTTNWLTAVAYGGGQYIAVGDNGCILLSPDGVAWLNVSQSATSERLNNVIFAAGQYVAVGEEGAIVTSPDGRNWTSRASGVTGWLRGLTYLNAYPYKFDGAANTTPLNGTEPARFVAAGQGGAIITSTDGATWSNEEATYSNDPTGPWDSGGDIEALVANQSQSSGFGFVAVGAGGTSYISYWIQMTPKAGGFTLPYEGLMSISIPVGVDFRGLVLCGNTLYATGENGTIESGLAGQYVALWQQLASGTAADLVAGVAIGDTTFFVGDNETIIELTAPYDSRLINVSCRANVGTGANILIAGFVVGGQGTSGSEPLLIRASGPALVPFGVAGTLPDPELQLISTASSGGLLATNSSWSGAQTISAAAEALGAFAWPNPSSHDAALLPTLDSGPYTANISGETGDTGVALAEVYDATPAGSVGQTSPRLINISARTNVGTGGNVLIAGFVIGGTSPKTVLIRASGPALIPFGVTGSLPDPELQLFSSASASTALATNTGWGGDPQIATAAARVGAFSWGSATTPDSAILITLLPGAYTAQVSGASGDTGLALVEVYEVN